MGFSQEPSRRKVGPEEHRIRKTKQEIQYRKHMTQKKREKEVMEEEQRKRKRKKKDCRGEKE